MLSNLLSVTDGTRLEKKKKAVAAPGEKPLTAKEKKDAKMREQMDAMDAMVNQIYGL